MSTPCMVAPRYFDGRQPGESVTSSQLRLADAARACTTCPALAACRRDLDDAIDPQGVQAGIVIPTCRRGHPIPGFTLQQYGTTPRCRRCAREVARERDAAKRKAHAALERKRAKA